MQVPVSGKASPGGPGGKRDEYEKAVTWQRKTSQAILTEAETHWEKGLSFYSAFSRVSCPSLGPPIQNSYWEIEPFSTRLWRCWDAAAFVLWREAEEAGFVHRGKEMALVRLKSRPQVRRNMAWGILGHGRKAEDMNIDWSKTCSEQM